jgi:bile acid-coenzyme A ligase
VSAPNTHGICSSGSTGQPKVILIDMPATWSEERNTVFPSGWIDVPRPQTVLVPAPMYHTNGFASFNPLLAGDRLVILEKFDAALVAELLERERITTFTATPTMLQRIADLPDIDDRDLSSLVWVLQGAAVIPPSLVRRWADLIGADRFYMAYGMTEGLGLAALRADEWLAHPGSVGRGYRDTEIRILDGDGNDLPPGEIGEIYLRSPTSGMYRYLGGAARLPMTTDGFGTAGDLGHLDEDGFLYIADRRVDMIISGGANVFPAEVENALIEHDGIADVVVIGLKDPEWGRRVHAVIEPADPADPPAEADVIAFAKSRLAAYKVPKSVEVVDEIPRSAATKVSRSALVDARGG